MVECFYCGETMESDGEGGHVCRSAACAPSDLPEKNYDPDSAAGLAGDCLMAAKRKWHWRVSVRDPDNPKCDGYGCAFNVARL